MMTSNSRAGQEQETMFLGQVRMKLKLRVVKIQRVQMSSFKILED